MFNAFITAAIAAGILTPHLLEMRYAATDPAFLLFIGIGVTAGFLIGLASSRWQLAGNIILALFASTFADIYFFYGMADWAMTLVLGVALVFVLQTKFQDSLKNMLLVFALVWTISNVLTPTKPLLDPPLAQSNALQSAAKAELPPIIHFIVDEQMSPLALPETIPAGHPVQDLMERYAALGFDLYPNTFSLSSATQISLSGVFGLQETKENFKKLKNEKFNYTINNNAYFERLQKAGYTVSLVQTNYLELCKTSETVSCHTYSRADSATAMNRFDMSQIELVAATASQLRQDYISRGDSRSANIYAVFDWMAVKLGLAPRPRDGFVSRPALVLNILDDAEAVLAAPKRGHAYIFHLLLPHFPYVLDTACELKPSAQWYVPHRHGGTDVPEIEIYKGLWDQTACAHKRLLVVIQSALASATGKDALIMVHGDHGARIKDGGRSNDRRDKLQTIFMIKSPRTNGTIHKGEETLQHLFPSLLETAANRS